MALLSPYLAVFGLKDAKNGTEVVCTLIWKDNSSRIIHFSFLCFGTYFIPFFAITVMYTVTIGTLYKRSRDVVQLFSDEQVRSRQRRNDQIFRLSIVIVLSCAVCLGPIFCYLMVITFTWKSNIKSIGKETFDYIFFIVRYFGYLNSVVNPCIYFVFIKTYRQGLKRLLRCERHSRGGSNPVHENNAEEMRLTAVRPNLNNHPTT